MKGFVLQTLRSSAGVSSSAQGRFLVFYAAPEPTSKLQVLIKRAGTGKQPLNATWKKIRQGL